MSDQPYNTTSFSLGARMKPEDIDIDWLYLIERIENLIDLGEEILSRRVATVEFEPQIFLQNIAFTWNRVGTGGFLSEITAPAIQPLSELIGIDETIAQVRRNTLQFVLSLPANNLLLWGEAGSGKSSCIKGLLHEFSALGLRLIDVRIEDLDQLTTILTPLKTHPYRFILYCDDLPLHHNDKSTQALKRVLDGGIEGFPENVVIYATSRCRDILAASPDLPEGGASRYLEAGQAGNPSLADRFGLRLPFYRISESTYLAIIAQELKRIGIKMRVQTYEEEARRWATTQGGVSGWGARQFASDLSGRILLSQQAKKVRGGKKI